MKYISRIQIGVLEEVVDDDDNKVIIINIFIVTVGGKGCVARVIYMQFKPIAIPSWLGGKGFGKEKKYIDFGHLGIIYQNVEQEKVYINAHGNKFKSIMEQSNMQVK